MPSSTNTPLQPPKSVQLPLNRNAALAIEQAIKVLQTIVERHPEVRRDFDCESFIHHELAPALEAIGSQSEIASPASGEWNARRLNDWREAVKRQFVHDAAVDAIFDLALTGLGSPSAELGRSEIVEAATRYVGIYEGWVRCNEQAGALQSAFEALRSAVGGKPSGLLEAVNTAYRNIESLMCAYPDRFPQHAFEGTRDLLREIVEGRIAQSATTERTAARTCTCYVLPHDEDCELFIGIAQSGERVLERRSDKDRRATETDLQYLSGVSGMEIFVNGGLHRITEALLAYEDVVKLAGHDPKRVLTVTYLGPRDGDSERSGSMHPGCKPVRAEHGMHFDVGDTSNA